MVFSMSVPNINAAGTHDSEVNPFYADESEQRGAARLVSGKADPGGAWAYGRLEVHDGSSFTTIFDSSAQFGRRAAEVACRSLGFASGAQLLSGESSALPGGDGMGDTISRVECDGSEDTLADCDIAPGSFYSNYGDADDSSVALVCSTPSGAPPRRLATPP